MVDATGEEIHFTFDADTVFGTSVQNEGSNCGAYFSTLVNGASISSSEFVEGASSVQLVATDSQYVQLPSYTFASTGISIACWFRSDSSVDYSRVFEFSEGRTDGVYLDYFMMYIKGGYLGLFIGTEQVASVSVNDNVWRHVTWTIDNSGTWVLYVNGVDVWDITGAGYPISIVRTQNFLGHSFLGFNPFFNGAIDDFRVFNGRVLTGDDVLSLYHGIMDYLLLYLLFLTILMFFVVM